MIKTNYVKQLVKQPVRVLVKILKNKPVKPVRVIVKYSEKREK